MKSQINLFKAWGHVQYEDLMDSLNKKDFSEDSIVQKHADQIESIGISILENYYSEERCDLIIKDIDSLIEKDEVNIWKDKSESDTRIYGSHKHSALVKEFHDDPFLKSIGQQYLNSELINSHTLGARLVSQPNNLGSGGGWHRDSVFKKQFKSIVYLSDVTPNNGPFEFLLDTHKEESIYKSITKNGFKSDQNRFTHEEIMSFLESNPEYKSETFPAKKGTVILVNTRGIHRGMPIIGGSRYALTNYFFPKHHYTESQKKKFEKLM